MSYWSQSALQLEAIADRLTARIIEEAIEGPERERMLARHSDYLRMANDHWNWHYHFGELAAQGAGKETEE